MQSNVPVTVVVKPSEMSSNLVECPFCKTFTGPDDVYDVNYGDNGVPHNLSVRCPGCLCLFLVEYR